MKYIFKLFLVLVISCSAFGGYFDSSGLLNGKVDIDYSDSSDDFNDELNDESEGYVEKEEERPTKITFQYLDKNKVKRSFTIPVISQEINDPRPAEIATIEERVKLETIREKAAAMLKYYNKIFHNHLEEISNNSHEIYELGNYYFVNNQYEKAREVFSKNIDTIENLFGAATTNRFLGDYDMAIAYYSEVIDKNSNLAEPYLGRGICYRNKEKTREALADFLKYKSMKNSEEAYAALGNIYIIRKDFSNAKFVLNEGKLLYPKSKIINDLLVRAHGK